MNYKIYPPDGILEATVGIPLSKSVSNRALIINALTKDAAPLAALARCSDTEVMQRALADSDATAVDARDAGTAMRFLAAYFASRPGRSVTIDGTERMRQRPIGPLVDSLRSLGADIEYAGIEGFPPLKINGRTLNGGAIEIDATISSQFISALLMVAPTMTRGLELRLKGEAASLPYIDLTLDMMARAGIDCERTVDVVTVSPGEYSAETLPAEGDWSAAAFWYEIVALTGGFLTIEGLDASSRQPDRRTIELFEALGATTEEGEEEGTLDLSGSPDVSPRLVADLSSTPDLAPAVAVTCGMVGVPFRLTGLRSLRIKETDRLSALATELEKIGVVTEITGDHTLEWDGRRRPLIEVPVFDTYNDHRMAMALAPVATYIPGIVVRDAEVVAKSYPEYWDHLREAGFELTDADSPVEDQPSESD